MSSNRARAATIAGGSALAILLSSTPAWAIYQWPNCTFGEIGSTYWRVRGDVDSINPFYGLWENRNGDLVRSETQYLAIDGPARFRIYGEGSTHWALRGVYLDSDNAEVLRATRCEGGDAAAAVNTAYNAMRSTVPLTVSAALPPVPNLAYVPLVDDITVEATGT